MSELQTLTVKRLRTLAGDLGLPKYQHKGRRLRKADLVASISRRMRQLESNVYRALPGQRTITADNGASGVARIEHPVLEVYTDRRRYADPTAPGKLFKTKRGAFAAVCRRVLRESGATAQQQAKTARGRKWTRPLSQQEIVKRLRDGQYVACQEVAV